MRSNCIIERLPVAAAVTKCSSISILSADMLLSREGDGDEGGEGEEEGEEGVEEWVGDVLSVSVVSI